MRNDDILVLLNGFGIKPNDLKIYDQAFTHASYTNEHPDSPSYDRLEYLGDSILDMVIADILYEKFPNDKSGLLSKKRSVLVEGKMLTFFSEEKYHLAPLVRYSEGEKNNVKFHKHIHEDIFESFIAAIYVDQGYETVRRVIEDIYAPYVDDLDDLLDQSDAKSKLQEILESNIEYVVISQKDMNSDDVSFTVEARVNGMPLGVGVGHNTKEAEINAAKDALSKRVGD